MFLIQYHFILDFILFIFYHFGVFYFFHIFVQKFYQIYFNLKHFIHKGQELMNQSEPKPRVVTKNLEDIIKQSAFSTKRNSIDDLIRCQHNPNTEPRNKNPGEKHQRCKTNGFNQEIEQKNSLSMSKHSLSSKEKIIVNGVDKQKNKHSKIRYKERVEINKLKEKKSIPNNPITKSLQNPSLYFNHVDVIFTELEDFLRETRESVLTVFNGSHSAQTKQSKNEMTKEMEQLFFVFQEELQRLVKKYKKDQKNCKNLKQNNRKERQGSLIKKSESKQIGKQKSSLTKLKDSDKKNDCSFKPNPLGQIAQNIQHQNILNSTILSDHQQNDECSYFPTETSTEMLSMLALKKEFNNAKRKFQNPLNPSIQWKQNKTKKQGSEGEYSFRNKHFFENISQTQAKSTSIISSDKNKKTRKPSCESQNKENRQKSVYELVLEENKRQKLGVCK